jgi:hypothetical protein
MVDETVQGLRNLESARQYLNTGASDGQFLVRPVHYRDRAIYPLHYYQVGMSQVVSG